MQTLIDETYFFFLCFWVLFLFWKDSVSGVKAGVAAGMPVIGMGLRNPEKSLVDAGASFVINDFNDPKLWTALEELENKGEITTVIT